MSGLRFALLDNTGYMELFSKYLQEKNPQIENWLFTETSYLEEYLKSHSVDVLLYTDAVKAEVRDWRQVRQRILLSRGDCVNEESDTVPVVFQYQSARQILQEIYQILAQNEQIHSFSSGISQNTRFWGVFAPYGGWLALDETDWQRWDFVFPGKSLLVRMELLDSMGQEETALSQLVFFLKQRSARSGLKIKSQIRTQDAMDVLSLQEDYRDLLSLGKEDMEYLMEVLRCETEYEIVIFYADFLSEGVIHLMKNCQRVFAPAPRFPGEVTQRRSLEVLLNREGMGEMVERIEDLTC